MQLKLGK
ncbi:unnamed protein product, partial [Rotaria sordida]